MSTSIADRYSYSWEALTSESYSSNQEMKMKLLESFESLAVDREDCYTLHCKCHGDGKENDSCTVFGSNCIKYGRNYCKIELHPEYHTVSGINIYTRCETTAYFMQFLALLAAKKDIPTALTDVSKRFESTKWSFIKYSVDQSVIGATCYIVNPHQQISYYILSRK